MCHTAHRFATRGEAGPLSVPRPIARTETLIRAHLTIAALPWPQLSRNSPVGPPLRVGMHTEVTCGRVGGEEVGGAGLVSLLVHLRPVSELGLGFRVRVRV